MKRLAGFAAPVLITALIAGCGGGVPQPAPTQPPPTSTVGASSIPPRPVIIAVAGSERYEGVPGDSCWVVGADDVECTLGEPDPRPRRTILLEAGDALTFEIEDAPDVPDQITAVLLDDLDARGEPVELRLESGLETEWVPENLGTGSHRVLVRATFPNIAGEDDGYVEYVFNLRVEGEVAAVPTSPLTEESPTESTVVISGWPTPLTPEVETPTGTSIVFPPLVTPTGEATEVPIILPPALGTTAPPGRTTQPSPSPTSGLVASAITPTPSPTSPPSPTPLPLGEGPMARITVETGGVEYLPVGTHYCVQTEGAEEMECGDESGSDDRIVIPALYGAVQIHIDGSTPLRANLRLFSSDYADELAFEERPGDVLYLYTPPVEDAGSYILSVEAIWDEGTVTSYFQLLLTSE